MSEKSLEFNVGKMVFWFIIIMFILITIFSTGYIVQAGERGVLLTFGKASDAAITEGLHFKVPFAQSIVKMDIRTQKYEAKASAASADLQTVSTDVTLNYYILPGQTPTIYKEIGVDYQDKVINPAVQEVVKASTAKYTAEELITKRPQVKDLIDTGLRDRLAPKGIIIQDVLITNFDFSTSFNAAIEAKVTAEQNALAAKNKLEQVKFEAEQRVTQATAEATAIQIQAQAIQAQGGAAYVQLQAISKWNGILPQYSGGAIPFIQLPATTPTG